MKVSHSSRKNARISLMIILIASLVANLALVIEDFGAPQQPDTYSYRFVVDSNGSALVSIIYNSSKKFGSSWIVVPRFIEFRNYTSYGRILDFTLRSTKDKLDVEYYFYSVLDFSFESNGHFEMVLQYNFTTAAMIIEPKGVFLSPQIGFQPDGVGKAEVMFPSNFKVQRASAEPGYPPTFTNSNYVRFDNLPRNFLRLEVNLEVGGDQPSLLKIQKGVFTFETVRRYEKYALEILDLYDVTYDDFVSLFNTTLERVNIEFFIPEFESILSIGGYVPFSEEKIGDIHINIFQTRYVKGYVEVTALHELVHHFLWRAGISPKALLWFHEGMAQYVSVEKSIEMELEGAFMVKRELENAVSNLGVRNDLSFLCRWTPSTQPGDWGTLYGAAYYVVTRLAEHYGGLKCYARFFKFINGIEIEDNDELAYYLSLAANETVVPRLRLWGFDVVDLHTHSTLIMQVERSLQAVNPFHQPYKFFAEQLYRWALMNAKQDRMNIANRLLIAAMIVAKLSPLLTLITISATFFGAILYLLKQKGLFSD